MEKTGVRVVSRMKRTESRVRVEVDMVRDGTEPVFERFHLMYPFKSCFRPGDSLCSIAMIATGSGFVAIPAET